MTKITTIHSLTDLWEGYLKIALGLKAYQEDFFRFTPVDCDQFRRLLLSSKASKLFDNWA